MKANSPQLLVGLLPTIFMVARTSLIGTTRNIIFKDNPFVTWEAYVLFTLGLRAEKMSKLVLQTIKYFMAPLEVGPEFAFN